MSQSTTYRSDYGKAVDELVAAHAQEPPADLKIFLCRDNTGEIVRLVEVSEEFGEQTDDVAWAVAFRSTNRMPYGSAIILLTPPDFVRLQDGRLRLPDDWPGLGGLEQVYPAT